MGRMWGGLIRGALYRRRPCDGRGLSVSESWRVQGGDSRDYAALAATVTMTAASIIVAAARAERSAAPAAHRVMHVRRADSACTRSRARAFFNGFNRIPPQVCYSRHIFAAGAARRGLQI